MAQNFQLYITNIGIIIQNTLIETNHFIYIVEHYHRFLWQIYSIITIEISGITPI